MLRIGLVGVGRGRLMQYVARRPDVRFGAVCDPKLAEASACERILGELKAVGMPFAHAYGDFDRFVTHDLDLVMVASPAPFHGAQSCAALRSGKDVICEVPAVMSLEEARDLVRAVRESGRRYLFAENCCYWGFVRAWSTMIAEGRIGTPYYLEGEYIHDVRYLMRDEKGQQTWRASLSPIRYCTHETGPLFDMLQDRGVSVSCRVTGSLRPARVPRPGCRRGAGVHGQGCSGQTAGLLQECRRAGLPSLPGVWDPGHARDEDDRGRHLRDSGDIPHLQGRVSLPLGRTALKGLSAAAGHGGADAAMLNDLDALVRRLPRPSTSTADWTTRCQACAQPCRQRRAAAPLPSPIRAPSSEGATSGHAVRALAPRREADGYHCQAGLPRKPSLKRIGR